MTEADVHAELGEVVNGDKVGREGNEIIVVDFHSLDLLFLLVSSSLLLILRFFQHLFVRISISTFLIHEFNSI